MNRRRWSDNDRHFGPFTYSRDRRDWPLSVVLDSGHDEYPGCHLRLRGFGHTLIVELPPIIRPWRQRIVANWDAATVERLGRNWYWNEHAREYGFSYGFDGFLQVFLGPQTHNSTTTKMWCKHLPWTQWRFVRRSLYDLQGGHFWTEPSRKQVPRDEWWDLQERMRKEVPKAAFLFDDYDGKRITATTHIEEMEWKFGEGWFKWLSLFRKPKVRRSLDIKFSEEVGPEKGSWKGGTTGHGIEMLPGELHEAAFRRYCAGEHRSKYGAFRITFVGAAP